MNNTLENPTTTPQVGELWLPVAEGKAVIITGVITEDSGAEVLFSTLNSLAYTLPLEDFVDTFSKRVYSF